MIGKLDVVDHRARIIAQSSVGFSISCIMNLSVGGGIFMKIQVSELEHGLRLVTLNGQLDGTGVYSVEVDFIRNCVEGAHNVLVDLSNVSYISSIGIPMLIRTAKMVKQRGGKLALLNPQHNVLDVLDLVGVSRIIPVFYDHKAAMVGMSDE